MLNTDKTNSIVVEKNYKRKTIIEQYLGEVVSFIAKEYDLEIAGDTMLLMGFGKESVVSIDYMFERGKNSYCDFFLSNHILGLHYRGRTDKFSAMKYPLTKIYLLVDVELFRCLESGTLDKELSKFLREVRANLVIYSDKYKEESSQDSLTIECKYLTGIDVDISYFRDIKVKSLLNGDCYGDFMKNTGKSCSQITIVVRNIEGILGCFELIKIYGNREQTVIFSLPFVKLHTLVNTRRDGLTNLLHMRSNGYKLRFHDRRKLFDRELELYYKRCCLIVVLLSQIEGVIDYYDTYLSLFTENDILWTKKELYEMLSTPSMQKYVYHKINTLRKKKGIMDASGRVLL